MTNEIAKLTTIEKLYQIKPTRVLKALAVLMPSAILILQWYGGTNLKDYVEKETIRELLLLLFWWGPALWILGGFFYLAKMHIPQFISAQREQAVAIKGLADTVREHNEREAEDRDERREILINLRVLATKIDELRGEMTCLRLPSSGMR